MKLIIAVESPFCRSKCILQALSISAPSHLLKIEYGKRDQQKHPAEVDENHHMDSDFHQFNCHFNLLQQANTTIDNRIYHMVYDPVSEVDFTKSQNFWQKHQ